MGQLIRLKQRSWLIASTAVAGQLLVAVLTALLARKLSLDEFEAYAVAASAFLLLVAMAPLGAEKLALLVLPPLIQRGDWARINGYLRFALRRAAIGTLLVTSLGLVWALGLRDLTDAARTAFLVAAVGVPVGVLAHLGLEVMTAAGAAQFATVVIRLVVPCVTLVIVLLLPALGAPLTGAVVIAAWGAGWAMACMLYLWRICAVIPPEASSDRPRPDSKDWRSMARPFWAFRIAVGLMTQAGIIALNWMGATATAVGAYAAATSVVGLLVVVSTSTNRAYSREIAILLERRAYTELAELRRRRQRWLLPFLVLAVTVLFIFSRQILAAFRPDFVEVGLWPIRILALAAAFTMTCALAPTILKYRDRRTIVFRTVGAGACLQILLLLLLVPRHGATGAALGYAVSVVATYGWFAKMANDELRSLRAALPLAPARQ